MDAKYKYLCAVEAGDSLYAATMPTREATPGDLVILDSGVQGYVTDVVFMNIESDEFKFFNKFIPVDEVVDSYVHAWHKTEESEAE